MTELKAMRERIYTMQEEYEKSTSFYIEPTVRVSQRIRALLNIYEQMLNGKEFEDFYLQQYGI